jgi:hypothetical protein
VRIEQWLAHQRVGDARRFATIVHPSD